MLGRLLERDAVQLETRRETLDAIRPNFPPGVLQSDPRYSNLYYNMSEGEDSRGPWNEGKSVGFNETWQYVDDPKRQVDRTNGLLDTEPTGTDRTLASVEKADKQLGKKRSAEIDSATPLEDIQWSRYAEMAEEIG